MQTVNLFTRLTRKYRDGWSSNDAWDFLATVKVTPPKVVREPSEEEFSDGGSTVRFMRAPSGVNKKLLLQAIRDTMTTSRCRHDYDCCGCRSSYVVPRFIDNRTIAIVENISYNY